MATGAQASRKVADDKDIAGDRPGPHDSVGQAASDLGAEASDFAANLADAAKGQTRTLLDAAKGQATSFADSRKDTVAQAVADIASSLRDSGEGFADRPNIQGFVSAAADGLDGIAGSLRDRTFGELYGEAEDFARRQPVAVGIGAVAVGFLLARFIKSSADELSDAHAARSAAVRRSTAV